jgi:hypothetical protein
MSAITMTEVTDPEEVARAKAQFDLFDRNIEWYKAHASEIFRKHRGRHICIAGQELFVADTSQDARALGKQAHPEDNGTFAMFIPKEKLARIYADRW